MKYTRGAKSRRKKFVFLDDFSKEEIFKWADELAEDECQVKPLEGKKVVLLFPESSIRTRVASVPE